MVLEWRGKTDLKWPGEFFNIHKWPPPSKMTLWKIEKINSGSFRGVGQPINLGKISIEHMKLGKQRLLSWKKGSSWTPKKVHPFDHSARCAKENFGFRRNLWWNIFFAQYQAPSPEFLDISLSTQKRNWISDFFETMTVEISEISELYEVSKKIILHGSYPAKLAQNVIKAMPSEAKNSIRTFSNGWTIAYWLFLSTTCSTKQEWKVSILCSCLISSEFICGTIWVWKKEMDENGKYLVHMGGSPPLPTVDQRHIFRRQKHDNADF